MSARFAEQFARLLGALTSGRASAEHRLDHAAGILRGKVLLRSAKIGEHVYVGRGTRLSLHGDATIGDGTCIFSGMIPTEIICRPGAALAIGAGCELNYGVSIEARRLVRIGDRCKIGSMVRIVDDGRRGPGDVLIGCDVWIAHGAVIEPGVTIGDGSVVSAGSVVTSSVPPGCLAMGNPARPVKLEVMARAQTTEDRRA